LQIKLSWLCVYPTPSSIMSNPSAPRPINFTSTNLGLHSRLFSTSWLIQTLNSMSRLIDLVSDSISFGTASSGETYFFSVCLGCGGSLPTSTNVEAAVDYDSYSLDSSNFLKPSASIFAVVVVLGLSSLGSIFRNTLSVPWGA
jgi:hypothetical protein